MGTIGWAASAALLAGFSGLAGPAGPELDGPSRAPGARAAPEAPEDAPDAVVKQAQDALAQAGRVRREAYGQEGEPKLAAMQKAARAYEQVAAGHAGAAEVVAEAWFRAGELWRSMRNEEEARRCFTAATKCAGATPEYPARSLLELGHLERRQKRFDDALKIYARVLDLKPEPRHKCAQALTWRGKVQIEMKDVEQGHATLLSVGQRYPDFPLDDIRNVDAVAVDWIEAGRVAEARRLVDDCVERHSLPIGDDPEVEPEVRRALERMKARERLSSGPRPGDR